MTSEVVILNKHAVVIAADSAVTTTTGVADDRPRFSKCANKIFDLSSSGNVGATIYGNAEIDAVPWELVIKSFRRSLESELLPSFENYADRLVEFLNANSDLFPREVLSARLDKIFVSAARHVIRKINDRDPRPFDENLDMETRSRAWGDVVTFLETSWAEEAVHRSLSEAAMQVQLGRVNDVAQILQPHLGETRELDVIDAEVLARLAVLATYKEPTAILSSTGIVVAGYGATEIFPGYRNIAVYGHIGTELLFEDANPVFKITHDESSGIQAFAQTSMIDVFTDGFGYSLFDIIYRKSKESMLALVEGLRNAGATIPPDMVDSAINVEHEKFMLDWRRENWTRNYAPLRRVIGTLGIQEMAEVAETLLVLESLKERVTSSSESVGGPIDVAVITKSEGMVWLKRKHFFNPELNLRYVNRLQQSLRS